MTEGLLRQRRNLFITCVLLWVMKYGGVTFTKFSLAGFDVVFARPGVLILAIWVAYAYFLYRYYQYFSKEGVLKLKSVFAEALEEKCEPVIRSLVKRAHPHYNVALRRNFATLRGNGWIYQGQDLIPDGGGTIREVPPFELRIAPWKLSGGVVRAILDSIFRNSVVTDYLLPFAFADYILWYCGALDWYGSPLQFFLT